MVGHACVYRQVVADSGQHQRRAPVGAEALDQPPVDGAEVALDCLLVDLVALAVAVVHPGLAPGPDLELGLRVLVGEGLGHTRGDGAQVELGDGGARGLVEANRVLAERQDQEVPVVGQEGEQWAQPEAQADRDGLLKVEWHPDAAQQAGR